MLKKNSKGITLVEVFAASFIFIISVSAVFTTLLSTRKPAVSNDQEVQAALVLRNTLEWLRSKVDSRKLSLVNHDLSIGTHTISNTGPGSIYNVIYNVSQDATTGVYRVDATASWPDAL